MKAHLGLAVACLALARLADVAHADETNLIFATLTPADGHSNVDTFHPWAEHINEVGKGVLHLDVRDGFAVANRTNFYTRVLEDVVQVAFGPQGSVGGQFPRSSVLELPFEAQKASTSSVAFWRLYKTGLLDAEYKDIVPLWVANEPQASLHMVRPLQALDNLDGLKILVPAKVQSELVERLGATPIALPLEDAYSALQRHTVDGMYFPWTGLQTYKLADVTSYHINTSLGGGGVMVFMARKKFASLPAATQKILEDNSGEKMALQHGASLDKVQDQVLQSLEASPGQKVVTLSPNEEKLWRRQLVALADAWAKSVPDGEKVLEAYRTLIAKVEAGG